MHSLSPSVFKTPLRHVFSQQGLNKRCKICLSLPIPVVWTLLHHGLKFQLCKAQRSDSPISWIRMMTALIFTTRSLFLEIIEHNIGRDFLFFNFWHLICVFFLKEKKKNLKKKSFFGLISTVIFKISIVWILLAYSWNWRWFSTSIWWRSKSSKFLFWYMDSSL